MNTAHLLSALITILFCSNIALAQTTVVVNPAQNRGDWEGWGASLCWWANQFGDREDLAEIAFGREDVKRGDQLLPGLGLNIVRYNLGGCGPGMKSSPKIPPFKQIEAFWLNAQSSDPSSASFDWSRDAKQRAMLQKAKARGANRFELFVNSPAWWMCKNSNSSGSDGGAGNLQDSQIDNYARSIVFTLKQAKDDWGIQFDFVSPFNEPSANWWKSDGTQEGCHFDLATQQRIIKTLRQELTRQGLADVKISASDENSIDDALKSWKGLDASSKRLIGKLNVHGYYGLEAYRGPHRADLNKAVNVPICLSEYGEKDGTGRTMAESILLDFADLRPTSWVYWQPFDSGGWGLIQCNPGDDWIGPANPKYFVMAQFTRHLRDGMKIIGTNRRHTVAAYSPSSKSLVLITVNLGSMEERLKFDLSHFKSVGTETSAWITSFDGQALYRKSSDLKIENKSLNCSMPAGSVQTIELLNIQ